MINRTKELQAKIDGPSVDIDLNGEVWPVSRLIISPKSSGKTIRNGEISYFGPDGKPQYGLIELVQNKKYNGVIYPAGDVSVKLSGVSGNGTFDFDCGFQAHNELVAEQQNKDFNFMTNITYGAGTVTIENCQARNFGGSAWAGTCSSLNVLNFAVEKIAKHVIGCRASQGGMKVFIDGVTTRNCGNTFDLSVVDKEFYDFYKPDFAVIKNVVSYNNRGRTKQASRNWVAKLSNLRFEQDDVVNMNLYPALDMSFRTHSMEIDGLTSVNYPMFGFGTLSDTRTDGVLEVRNMNVINSMSLAKVQQRLSLQNTQGFNCYQKYTSGVAIESNVNIETQTAQYWADIFEGIETLYHNFNTIYGTAYEPAYTIPTAIRNLMWK